jgi:hypothetical protein
VTFVVLAASSSSASNVAPGALGFLVVAGIGVALVFLLRSMNKQFRKITPDPSATPSTTAHADDPATGPQPPS